MQHVLAEVQVIAGEGSSHVVIGLVPAVCQLPELRNSQKSRKEKAAIAKEEKRKWNFFGQKKGQAV